MSSARRTSRRSGRSCADAVPANTSKAITIHTERNLAFITENLRPPVRPQLALPIITTHHRAKAVPPCSLEMAWFPRMSRRYRPLFDHLGGQEGGRGPEVLGVLGFLWVRRSSSSEHDDCDDSEPYQQELAQRPSFQAAAMQVGDQVGHCNVEKIAGRKRQDVRERVGQSLGREDHCDRAEDSSQA